MIANPNLKDYIPKFLFDHPKIDTIRPFAQSLGGYAIRRAFIHGEFAELLKFLSDTKNSSNIAKAIVIDNEYIHITWQKALSRMESDPQGAITIARTLIETVCKHILDTSGKEYNDAEDLPVLYKSVASLLNLAPDQHTQEVFKQILGGCFSVVQGLGTMRNKISDAHGMSEKRIKPARRHAQLAVNLSGSLCQFLLESFIEKRDNS
ncbi:abortive infection family protein [Pedobacter jeongneungensis]|uniref:abortive infection family protein n=1 Tax=Pedobacter jeongneungensis TaxID=947309 RepID=UPI00046A3E34|nr:abortive infection family protein [Pedobacter jeongneungensis]